MLNSISIGNFKAFAEPQSIPIRPLTLIYGANSSGKSSILHSLILARNAQETGNLDVHRTNVGGEAVDLGGFRQFVHRKDAGLRVNWAMELDSTKLNSGHMDSRFQVTKPSVTFSVGVALDDRDEPLLDALPQICSYEVFSDSQSLIRMSRRSDGTLRLDRLNHEHRVFREFFDEVVVNKDVNAKKTPDVMGELTKYLSETVAFGGRFLPEWLEQSEYYNADYEQTLNSLAQDRRNHTISTGQLVSRVINSLLSGITETIYEELNRLQYLGPLRSYPPRTLAFAPYNDSNWYSGGGYAWDVVRSNSHVRKSVNQWLSDPDRLQTPYELVTRDLVAIDDLEKHLVSGLEEVELNIEPLYDVEPLHDDYHSSSKPPAGAVPTIEDVEAEAARLSERIRSSDIDRLCELIMVDQRSNTTVSHKDIGIGVSQVLPVLVGAYAAQNQIMAIEQPEIHLHPALQADLGDVFIQSALGDSKNRFLIESHSEHLLLRIMRRMRQTYNDELPDGVPEVTSKDVCILFVQPKGTSSVIRHLELDDEGQLLTAWPGGFFEEGFRERFE